MKTIVPIADRSIACEISGEGPPVLFVHAYPLDRSVWANQLPIDGYRSIAVDLPGFGESGDLAAGDAFEMSRYAESLVQVLDRLGVADPIVYVGVSMAGYIGWELFRTIPGRVRAAVLCCTKAAADTPEFAAKRLSVAEKVLREGSDAVTATARTLLGETSRERRPELESTLRALIRGTSPRAIAAAQRGMAVRRDQRDLLPTITMPVQLIAGEEDGFSPPEEMKSWATFLPNVHFAVIPEAGHLPMMEAPDQFRAVLMRFLREIDQSPANRRGGENR